MSAVSPTPVPVELLAEEIGRLRREHYNAVVASVRRVHDDLLIMRVRPDAGIPEFQPGQYATAGLGVWEPRVDGIAPIRSAGDPAARKLIRRAYSISCPMLDETGRLVRCRDCDYLELYITLIRRSTDDPPPLTPRLFALNEEDRLFVGPKLHGKYTLGPLGADDDVIFAGTGTGEAPHNAMIAELLFRGHPGRIVNLVSVRNRPDAAYADVHEELQRRFPNYRSAVLTTREPENLDPTHPAYVGKRYIQDLFAGGTFSSDFGWTPDPRRTHVFLCGNPAMIGLPRRDHSDHLVFPEPVGAVEVLTHLGFQVDEPRRPGNIHVDQYW